MTVVSYLKLSQQSGMGCADERETYKLRTTDRNIDITRTYDVARKIYRIGKMPIFVGTSGYRSYHSKVMSRANKAIGDKTEYQEVLSTLENTYHGVRNAVFESSFLKRYNLTWADVTAGKLPEGSSREIQRALEDPKSFDLALLVGGYDDSDKEFKIDCIIYPGTSESRERFASIGSGFDLAHATIGNSLDAMNMEDRNNIEKYKGAYILVEATQAAWRNSGVGGRIQLVWTEKDNFFELGLNESTFLSNTLMLGKKGYLKRPYVDSVFKRIIHDRAKATEIHEELVKRVGKDFSKRILLDSQIVR